MIARRNAPGSMSGTKRALRGRHSASPSEHKRDYFARVKKFNSMAHRIIAATLEREDS